jgi:DNA-binding transcriptional LysR family regulator
LRAFVVFAQHRNFTRAARELAITQPALHAQVSKLAEEVGARLYRRVGRGLELTETGVAVLRFGRESIARTEALQDELAGRATTRPVTLAAGEGAYLYLLGPAIRRYLVRPPAPLRLLTRDRERTLAAIVSGEADVGVAAFDGAPPGVRTRLMAEVPQVVIVPRRHRLGRKRRVRARDLDGERLIVAPAGRPQRSEIERVLGAAGARWQVAVEAGGWELMLHFARLGLGLAIVNGFCRVPAGFVARPLPDLSVARFFVLSPPDGEPRPPVAALLDTLEASS